MINSEIMNYAKTRNVKSLTRGTSRSAGIDFYVPDEWNDGNPYHLRPSERVLIPSGIKVDVPKGYALIFFNKSGVASKKGLDVLACVVDEDYQGEVHISMVNTGDTVSLVSPGEKLVQAILLPVNYAMPVETPLDSLYAYETARGEGGFGSTDK